jgi:prophage regulatory protein
MNTAAPQVQFPQSATGAIFLGTKEVCAVLRMAKSSLYRLISTGLFPKPVKLGFRRNGWLRSDVETFIANQIAAREAMQ